MAIADDLEKLASDLSDAYDVIEAKGGTMPEHKNTNNLPTAIESIQGGGGGGMTEWGSIKYYSKWTAEWFFSSDGGEITNLDQEKFDSFISEYPSSYPSFDYNDWEQTGNAKWVYWYDGGELEIAPENFESVTGITFVPYSEPMQYGYIYGEKNYVVDTDSPIVSLNFVEADLSEFGNYNEEYNFAGGTVYNKAITEFSFGSEWTSIPDGICNGWDNLVKVNYLAESNIATIGHNFLNGCALFNQPVIFPNSVRTVGDYCLGFNSSWNSPVILNNGLTTIGRSFLSGNRVFNQPISVPNSVTSIGQGFIQRCNAFNSSVALSSGLVQVPERFLAECASYNQPISIPYGVANVGMSFLYNCRAFNQPITLPTTVTIINREFLFGCQSFNQELTIPAGVTSIGDCFLQGCVAFNKRLVIPGSVRTIGYNFLIGCSAFNSELIISPGVQTIDYGFLSGCNAFNKDLTIPSSVVRVGSNSFQHLRSMQGVIDLTGVNINGFSTEFNGMFCFTQNELTSTGYVNGLKIKCDDYNSFLSRFPNGQQYPQTTFYRHTVQVS